MVPQVLALQQGAVVGLLHRGQGALLVQQLVQQLIPMQGTRLLDKLVRASRLEMELLKELLALIMLDLGLDLVVRLG